MTRQVRTLNVGTWARVHAHESGTVYRQKQEEISIQALEDDAKPQDQRTLADQVIVRTGINRFCKKYQGTPYCAAQCTRYGSCRIAS